MSSELHVVTGAFGYSGRWIAKQLLSEGKQVRTLTNAAARDDPFDGAVEVHQLNFNDYESLVESLRGADVLYNTYWVRYNDCLLYTSPSPRDYAASRMPSSA